MKNMKKLFLWKTKEKEIRVRNLKELMDTLINLKLENIEEEINLNIKGLISWLEKNFPEKMELLAHLKNIQEFTAQQVREQIIRDLRKQ